jgi:hypothetical protein
MVELEALKKRLFGDNKVKNIKFFPGHNADATAEDMAKEMNKFFADPHNASSSENELSDG